MAYKCSVRKFWMWWGLSKAAATTATVVQAGVVLGLFFIHWVAGLAGVLVTLTLGVIGHRARGD